MDGFMRLPEGSGKNASAPAGAFSGYFQRDLSDR